jgi:hypothetical protein
MAVCEDATACNEVILVPQLACNITSIAALIWPLPTQSSPVAAKEVPASSAESSSFPFTDGCSPVCLAPSAPTLRLHRPYHLLSSLAPHLLMLQLQPAHQHKTNTSYIMQTTWGLLCNLRGVHRKPRATMMLLDVCLPTVYLPWHAYSLDSVSRPQDGDIQ